MKYVWAKLLVLAVLGVLVVSSGCVYQGTDIVVTEKVCVNFDQTITSGTLSTYAVTDQFKEALFAALEENNLTLDDVKSIHMVSGTFKTMAVSGANKHDWHITADILIGRQDDPQGPYTDGPEAFTSFTDQSLQALKGSPTDAQLNAAGVAVVNNALEALRTGEDPRLVLTVDNGTVTPTPSVSDPMEFKLKTCVTFQAVLDGSAVNGQ